MPAFLDALHGHRFADERVLDRLGKAGDHDPGVPLGGEGRPPERDRAQTGEGLLVEFGQKSDLCSSEPIAMVEVAGACTRAPSEMSTTVLPALRPCAWLA